eukprot:sb/3472727/
MSLNRGPTIYYFELLKLTSQLYTNRGNPSNIAHIEYQRSQVLATWKPEVFRETSNFICLAPRPHLASERRYTELYRETSGLSTLVYPEEISCGIVSLGAECIEISKEFFVKHASENYLRKLKALIRPFPSEDKLQEDMSDQKEWCNYKNSIISEILDSSSI